MADLSPAAQAVLDAAGNAIREWPPVWEIAIGIALRAAVIELRGAYINGLEPHSADQWLDAIADELAGVNHRTSHHV